MALIGLRIRKDFRAVIEFRPCCSGIQIHTFRVWRKLWIEIVSDVTLVAVSASVFERYLKPLYVNLSFIAAGMFWSQKL